jgi:hypothetical protein
MPVCAVFAHCRLQKREVLSGYTPSIDQRTRHLKAHGSAELTLMQAKVVWYKSMTLNSFKCFKLLYMRYLVTLCPEIQGIECSKFVLNFKYYALFSPIRTCLPFKPIHACLLNIVFPKMTHVTSIRNQ